MSVKTYSDLGLSQYEGTNNVRGKLATLLDRKTIHGIQFERSSPNPGDVLQINVELGGEQVSSLLEGTIHFYAETGVVTMVAATFSGNAESAISTYGNQYLPQLYEVTRSGNAMAVTPIQQIYVSKADGKTVKYDYEDRSQGEWQLVFDYTTMGKLSGYSNSTDDTAKFLNSLFYFELPVRNGEYVMGGNTSGRDAQTYLVYLDIGGNAGSSGGSGEGGSGGTEHPPQTTGEISGIAFAYKDGNSYVQIKKGGNVVTFSITASADHGGAKIEFEPQNNNFTVDDVENNNTGQFEIKDTTSTGSGGSG